MTCWSGWERDTEEIEPQPARVSQEREMPVRVSEYMGRVILKREGDLCKEEAPGGTSWVIVIKELEQEEQKQLCCRSCNNRANRQVVAIIALK